MRDPIIVFKGSKLICGLRRIDWHYFQDDWKSLLYRKIQKSKIDYSNSTLFELVTHTLIEFDQNGVQDTGLVETRRIRPITGILVELGLSDSASKMKNFQKFDIFPRLFGSGGLVECQIQKYSLAYQTTCNRLPFNHKKFSVWWKLWILVRGDISELAIFSIFPTVFRILHQDSNVKSKNDWYHKKLRVISFPTHPLLTRFD